MDEHTSHDTQTSTVPVLPSPKGGSSLAIPASIVIGFGLIAGAIFFSGTTNKEVAQGTNGALQGQEAPAEIKKGPIKPIDKDDHIRGNPNAPIVILEYSDFDCPFCKNFHLYHIFPLFDSLSDGNFYRTGSQNQNTPKSQLGR